MTNGFKVTNYKNEKYLPINAGKSYLNTLIWLIKDGLSTSLFSSFSVVLGNFVGVFSGAIAFSLIVGFIKFHMEGKVISFKGFKLPEPPSGIDGLIMYGILSLLMGSISALLIYFSKSGTIKICRRYHTHCILRSIDKLVHFDENDFSGLKFLSSKHKIEHIPKIYCRFVAFSYRFSLDATLPLMTLIFASAMLLYLDAYVTFSLSPIILIFLVPIYKLNKRSSKVQGLILTAMEPFVKWSKDITKQISSSGNPFIRNDINNLFYNNIELNKMASFLYEPILLKFSADFFSRFLILLCMIWLFIIFGYQVISDKRSWVSVLTYLVALRFLGGSLQQVSSHFVNISRFYPAVSIFKKFIEKNIQNNKYDLHPDNLSLNFELSENDRPSFDLEKRITIFKGKPIIFLTPLELSNKDIKLMFQRSFLHESAKLFNSHNFIMSSGCLIETVSIIQNISGARKDKKLNKEIEQYLNFFNIYDDIIAQQDGLSTICNNYTIQNLNPETFFFITNGFSLFLKNKIIGINEKIFKECNSTFQEKFIKELNNNYIFLIRTLPKNDLDDEDKLIIEENELISDGERILGKVPDPFPIDLNNCIKDYIKDKLINKEIEEKKQKETDNEYEYEDEY